MNTSSNKKLRVAVICADLNPKDLGGAEVHIVEVVRRLAERGHEMHVFIGNDASAKSLFDSKNVHVHAVHYKKRANLNSLSFSRAAIREIPKHGPFDLLHAKQSFPQAIVGARLKKKLGIPLYVTVQNPLEYREELVLRGAFAWILKPFLWILDGQVRAALRAADLCASVSRYSEEHSKKMGARRTVLIPNGIDLDRFKFYEGPKRAFEIVTTSTLIPRNGIGTLIEALPSVVQDFPESRLKIAGEGPLKDQLVKRVKELNLEAHVEFLGTLEHEKIPKFVREAALFVRPSRHEGFGVSFIEAMALGTPVVTCPVGGIPDFVTDGETGYLVPPDDPEALSSAIHFVFKHHEAVGEVVKKARAVVVERYDWDKIAGEVESGYARCV